MAWYDYLRCSRDLERLKVILFSVCVCVGGGGMIRSLTSPTLLLGVCELGSKDYDETARFAPAHWALAARIFMGLLPNSHELKYFYLQENIGKHGCR